ncbi:MAG: hypothetical protein AB7Q15_03910 [Vicinamibacterales bacterium]
MSGSRSIAWLASLRVPALRNVARTPPSIRNGVFSTPHAVVASHNTPDMAPWPASAVSQNVNTEERRLGPRPPLKHVRVRPDSCR